MNIPFIVTVTAVVFIWFSHLFGIIGRRIDVKECKLLTHMYIPEHNIIIRV